MTVAQFRDVLSHFKASQEVTLVFESRRVDKIEGRRHPTSRIVKLNDEGHGFAKLGGEEYTVKYAILP